MEITTESITEKFILNKQNDDDREFEEWNCIHIDFITCFLALRAEKYNETKITTCQQLLYVE